MTRVHTSLQDTLLGTLHCFGMLPGVSTGVHLNMEKSGQRCCLDTLPNHF
jgi:hypothetical protein